MEWKSGQSIHTTKKILWQFEEIYKQSATESKTILQKIETNISLVSDTIISYDYLKYLVNNFNGGNIAFNSVWNSITSDKYILDIIYEGLKLNFSSSPPHARAHLSIPGPKKKKRSLIGK